MDFPHNFVVQSDAEDDDVSAVLTTNTEGPVAFMDETAAFTLERSFPQLRDTHDFTPNVELSEFLSRPVNIMTLSWTQASVVGTFATTNPWYAFFNDTRIKYKLNNYAFIKCNLKIKVVINASPFYYGALLMAYQPLQVFTPSTIDLSDTDRDNIPFSQRPHCWIYPQKNAGAEMTLPFFCEKNMLHVQTASDFTGMGQLDFRVISRLQSANAASGAGVTLQVYAWAEDVCISGASVGLALQSTDEYDEGPVSFLASAVATAAGMFKSVPFIGKYMTATQIGATAVGQIASMFGFCNPPVIKSIEARKPTAFPPLASAEISFPVEKLTLDPKNELTVDPSSVGLPNDDELTIPYLTQKESYLAQVDWTNSNSVNDLLFSSLVHPAFYAIGAGVNQGCYMTPIAWISAMFLGWRGDIIFRFKFIASKFHRGRVRISYDPYGYSGENILSDAVSTTVVFTEIVDLTEDTNVEVRVPYQQATTFLRSFNTYSTTNSLWSTSTSPSLPTFDGTTHNGTITVRVLTELTAPTTTADVQMFIFVRAADNFELANPVQHNEQFSNFVAQSGEVDDDNEFVHSIVAGTPSSPDPNRYLRHYGENIVSLRQLLHRYSFMETLSSVSGSAQLTHLVEIFSRMPRYFGFDPHGISVGVGLLVPGSNFHCNFTHNTPIQWLAPAFIANKGAVNYTFNPRGVGSENRAHMRCFRSPDVVASTASVSFITNSAAGYASFASRYKLVNFGTGEAGQALTNQRTNAGLTVSCPMYSQYNFHSTDPAKSTNFSAVDGGNRDIFTFECSSSPAEDVLASGIFVDKFVAAGSDFNLYYFLNVPVMRFYSAIPTAGTVVTA